MIKEILYDEVLAIRQKAMYADKDISFVKLENDCLGLHIGYFQNNSPVSVISLFLKNGELQFRKFATLDEFQNRGYGSKLIQWVIDYAEDIQVKKIWCNSRVNKIDFYKKFGFKETKTQFEKNGYRYAVLELILSS